MVTILVSLCYYFYVRQVPIGVFHGLLGPKIEFKCANWFIILRPFTSKTRALSGYNTSKVRALPGHKYGRDTCYTRLGYVVCKYQAYVLLTISALFQQNLLSYWRFWIDEIIIIISKKLQGITRNAVSNNKYLKGQFGRNILRWVFNQWAFLFSKTSIWLTENKATDQWKIPYRNGDINQRMTIINEKSQAN